MNSIKSLTLSLLLLAGSLYADSFGFDAGLFNLQFHASDADYVTSNRAILDNPICNAISNQERLELIVEGEENVSTKEKKIITKKLIVEPYAFGITREGKPVLRGSIVEEKTVKEVSLKYDETQFDEASVSDKGYFSGMFSSDKTKNIDIRKVSDIRVIQGDYFDAPEDYQGFKDQSVRVICEISVDDEE